jgi:tetratricopeptide (TPR) repeat protein
MDDAERQRYEQALKFFGKDPDGSFKQLMVAICLTQLGKFPDARDFYGRAIVSSLNDRFWYGTSQPNWLVDTYILANQATLYPEVLKEIEGYKSDPRGMSLMAFYAYALTCLIPGKDEEASDYVSGLLKKPKIKDTFAIGRIIKAIIEHDQLAFDGSLEDLLDAHKRMAKFGSLRETPEGFLCLPAMSLSKMALGRGMQITAESQYLSTGYLEYLQEQSP